MDNKHNTWHQGFFVDQEKYKHMTNEWKEERDKEEQLLVRPSPEENAICRCALPENAVWVADRLNKLSNIEENLEEHLVEIHRLCTMPIYEFMAAHAIALTQECKKLYDLLMGD